MSMSFKEPQPRALHSAVGVGQKLYVWGGGGFSSIKAALIETFDVPSLAWQQPKMLHGSQLPDDMRGMAVASNGESAYFFGGRTDLSTYFNTLFEINLSTLLCTELGNKASSTAPKKTCYSGMLYFDQKLVVHGGYTGQDETDDLRVFDLRTSKCACLAQLLWCSHTDIRDTCLQYLCPQGLVSLSSLL